MKQRDLELLSSYLDGQLGSADSARLEARLRTDPELRSVLQDLRGTRSLLRQLPMRKAPRNFTLTPKMVGKNPPLPRSYPVFRFAAALASILLFFTIGLNFVSQQAAFAPVGRGGGGGPETIMQAAPAATQPPAALPAATEAPATQAPAQAPSIGMAPLSTATAPAEDTANTLTSSASKEAVTENATESAFAQPPEVQVQPVQAAEVKTVSPLLQWILAGVALISLFVMAMMRQLSFSRWRTKS